MKLVFLVFFFSVLSASILDSTKNAYQAYKDLYCKIYPLKAKCVFKRMLQERDNKKNKQNGNKK